MNIKSQKDFFSGLMFLVVGLAFAIGASNYTIGSGARMGPGYFPLILGVLMAILGAAICVSGLTKGPQGGDKIGKWAWKPVFFVLAANFAFGILLVGVPQLHIPQFGLIIAIYA
ncbi:MAG: tripartite tricarboxylate transporter TctB family protein, partial [Comamonas sp.]